jgi:hypothetical protein
MVIHVDVHSALVFLFHMDVSSVAKFHRYILLPPLWSTLKMQTECTRSMSEILPISTWSRAQSTFMAKCPESLKSVAA